MPIASKAHPRIDVGGTPVSVDHYIGGRRVASTETFPDHSPLDWRLELADVSRGDAEVADLAVTAAVEGFSVWSAMTPWERGALLRRLADLIDTHIDRIAPVECLDMAMLEESLRLRVLARGARNFRAYAELAEQHEERTWSSNGTANRVVRMPAGPTVVITPWNAPFMLSTWKCAPALAAGNSVILKPAEWSPLSCSLLADLAHEAGLPPGVFNVVQGIGEEVGAALVADPRVRRISFTGSPETARHIGVAAARNIVPFTAELGGNAPFIVFDDADLDAAVEGAMASKYRNAGQTCVCANRIYAQAGIHDAFVERLSARVKALKLGNGAEAGTDIGPMIDMAAVEKTEEHIADAVAKGATLVTGGERKGGTFLTPALLTGVTAEMAVATEETFGPLAPVFRFETDAEVIAAANATRFGLAAYFYGQNLGRVFRLAEALDYGMVGINTGILSTEVAPFGGVKESGIGREGSKYGLDEYLETKYLCIGI